MQQGPALRCEAFSPLSAARLTFGLSRRMLVSERCTNMPIPRLPELLVILFIILLIFGAGKLPDVAASLGKSIRGFREAAQSPENKDAASSSSSTPKEKSAH